MQKSRAPYIRVSEFRSLKVVDNRKTERDHSAKEYCRHRFPDKISKMKEKSQKKRIKYESSMDHGVIHSASSVMTYVPNKYVKISILLKEM